MKKEEKIKTIKGLIKTKNGRKQIKFTVGGKEFVVDKLSFNTITRNT